MGDYIRNGPSNDAFNKVGTILPGKLPDLPNFKGCCNGWFKLSYVISAPLHMKGFWEFWAKDHKYAFLDRAAVTFDLLIHLTAWFTALGLEIWVNSQENRGTAILSEIAMVALWSLIVSLSGIVIAQAFAMSGGGQEAGKLFPTTYGAIVGGAYTSIIFSILWVLHTYEWAALVAQYDDDPSLDDNLKSQRHCVMWAIALKTCAVVTLKKNADFWGPCVIDENKEAAEKTSQYYRQNGMEA